MRNEKVYISHMLECLHNIDLCREKGKDAIFHDPIVNAALLRFLQEFAESSKRLSEETKARFPDIPWRDIADFRNVLVHDYIAIDMDIVYGVVIDELPKITSYLEALLEENHD